ncbi:MAG: glycosyltransferase, partial [bacterium]
MKITIISTAYPLRGGIAQYSAILYHKLKQNGHEVTVITFKRQYPKLLFPGKTQLETSAEEAVRIPSEPILDSIGPLSWIRVGKRVRQLQPDLILFKFWLPFFAPAFGVICWLAKKWTRARILYICDNVLPHEKRPGDLALTRFAFKRADYFIVQSKVVEQELLALVPQANYKRIPHPVYDIFGAARKKQDARRQLGLADERIILFFGYVRAYKGLDLLLRALPEILREIELKVLVVGEFYEPEKKYRALMQELDITGAVRIHSEFVPNEEVGPYFSAADVLVLPYKSATQSGIVQLAYHFNKPCIVTDVGGLAEVVVDGKTGFVVPPDDASPLAQAVIEFYRQEKESEFSANVEQEKKKYSWQRMIAGIEAFGGGCPKRPEMSFRPKGG